MSASRSDALLSRLELFGIRLGFENVRAILAALGNPHRTFRAVLVAGTNGKGSTAKLLTAMCQAAGYRVGLYTSPHLEAVTERLAINNLAISDSRLSGYLERIIAAGTAACGEPPTSFEALTIAAFLYFRDTDVDLAVLEVGLGGRLDATNVCDPILSLITSVSFDHERHLGTSLEAISREKCGILRSGKQAVAWADSQPVEAALRVAAKETGAQLSLANKLAISFQSPEGVVPQRARIKTLHRRYEVELHLAGRHQLRNLSIALLAAETLSDSGYPALDSAALNAGSRNCFWPGRLERVDLPDGRCVVLDAAHNAAGLEALLDHIEPWKERPDLLFGALAEKTISDVMPRLASACAQAVISRPTGERAAEPERWLPFFEGRSVHVESDLGQALDMALARCDRCLVVCGSIYLVGEVRAMLRQRFGVPEKLV